MRDIGQKIKLAPDKIEELVERLNAKGYVASMQRVDASTTKIFINPDGPEAAQAILTLSARVRELEQILNEMEPELRGMIDEQYKGTLHYPDQLRRYKRELGVCERARAAIAAATGRE